MVLGGLELSTLLGYINPKEPMTCEGKTVVIDGKTYELKQPSPTPHKDFVLVRTYTAGVHVGTLLKADGKVVSLLNARRVWRWKGANTLNELAMRGGDTGYTRISEPVPLIQLLEAIEIIHCSVEGAINLATSRWPA